MSGIVGRLVKCATPSCGAKCLPPHTLCGRCRKPAPKMRKAPTLYRKKRTPNPEVQERRARRFYGLERL